VSYDFFNNIGSYSLLNLSGDRIYNWFVDKVGKPCFSYDLDTASEIIHPVICLLSSAIQEHQYEILSELCLKKHLQAMVLSDGRVCKSPQSVLRWLSFQKARLDCDAQRKKEIAARTAIQASYPSVISLELTSACNLRCPQCACGMNRLNRKQAIMDKKLAFNLIQQLATGARSILLPIYGEVFLVPDLLLDVVKYAKSYYYTVNIATNGNCPNVELISDLLDCGVDSITVDLDALNQEDYSLYRRNGSLEKVKQTIKILVDLKKSKKLLVPHIKVIMIKAKFNQGQWEDFASYCESAGVDSWELKSMFVEDFDSKEQWLPKEPEHRRERYNYKTQEEYQRRNNSKFCSSPWTTLFVSSDHYAMSCCYDAGNQYPFGNLNENNVFDFFSIWNSFEAVQFRSEMGKGGPPEMCLNCCKE
jgi:MoaA/NifB/PqqE/SkfB family radical SAM enzyme